MNFLSLRSNSQNASSQQQKSDQENQAKPTTTLEGLIDEDPFPPTPAGRDFNSKFGAAFTATSKVSGLENHVDVTEDQGWITIPNKELPENWMEAPNILSFGSLDRSFVFPGEQVHILACLSPNKHDTEFITPFKVAAMMSKNGIGRRPKKENGNISDETDHVSSKVEVTPDGHDNDQNGVGKVDLKKDVSHGESLLRMEDHKRQTETMLQSFRNSHFFVRIADSHKSLWSRRRESGTSAESSSAIESFDGADTRTTDNKTSLSASIDRGGFDASASGGLARNSVECYALSNGDIVVLLQVSVGIDLLEDPVLEILQFEKYQEKTLSLEKQEPRVPENKDPSGDLLKWLLPLDNSIPPPSRPLSPPHPSLSSSASIRTTSSRPNSSASSTSQMFSFGNFRSYSMSALPPNTSPPPPVAPSPRPNFDTEDWNHFSYKNLGKPDNTGNEGLLSFRGVSLEPERFSVCCGLEGIYIPGNRWRRKIEIIQPVEINSFSAECNTEDLLCVQIKNVSPSHTPEIMVYLDAIMIIFERASKGGPPLSVPIACIEAGSDHSLPNLALRGRGQRLYSNYLTNKCTKQEKNVDLSMKIEEGFGPNGLGILSISDVPGYSPLRQNLLHLAPRLANLSEEEKKELEDPHSRYNFGWSHGKEKLESGKPDMLKGSFYANPIIDVPTTEKSLINRYPSYCVPNIWPHAALPELEVAFKALGKLILDVGLMVAYHCDRYVSKGITLHMDDGLEQTLIRSRCHKGRLLYYFPAERSNSTQESDSMSSWCGWHTDHGSLTGCRWSFAGCG